MASCTYDPNGNLASKTEGTDTWVYTWNAENQLVKVEKNGGEAARFAYDPLGRRVEKIAGALTASFSYEGESVLREISGGAAVKYVQGPTTDEPLALDDGTALSYFHVDGLGSIAKVTNATGAATVTRQYEGWGNLQQGSGEPGYAFTGREWDPETRLYYYRARYYDPSAGRFISEDPLRPSKHVWADPNPYPYVGDNPASRIDPSGMAWAGFDCAKKLAELAAAIAALNSASMRTQVGQTGAMIIPSASV